MKVNFNTDNNYKPKFGMSFLHSASKSHQNTLAETIGYYQSKICQRAFEQFNKEQSKIKLFDLSFNPTSKSVYLTNAKDGKVIKEFIYKDGKTAFAAANGINYPGKKFLTALFNPKKFLPQNFYIAGENAKELEAKKILQERLNRTYKI